MERETTLASDIEIWHFWNHLLRLKILSFLSSKSFEILYFFSGLGYASVIVSGLIGLYYNVVITHVLYYLYSSFTGKLPWMDCDNAWNTDKCFSHHAAVVNGTSSVNGKFKPLRVHHRDTAILCAWQSIKLSVQNWFFIILMKSIISLFHESYSLSWLILIN